MMLTCGLFGIGLDTYWPQFPGLRERLVDYQEWVAERLERQSITILNAGMVDDPSLARTTADEFQRAGVDFIVLFVSTYALSHTVLPVAQRTGKPILVLNLQPVPAIDYEYLNGLGDCGTMTGEWLAHCQACVAPEISSVFRRAGIPFHLVTDYLEDPAAWAEIDAYLAAALVRKTLEDSRIGVMGHYYNGMLDVYSDMTQLAATFGCHFELREFGELKAAVDQVSPADRAEKVADFQRTFVVSPE